jgi:hypothetical protein
MTILAAIAGGRLSQRAWMLGALFTFTVGLGGFVVGAILRAIGAVWEPPIRRIHEAVGGVLPLGAFVLVIAISLEPTALIGLGVLVALEETLRAVSVAERPEARTIAMVALPVATIATSLVVFDGVVPQIAPRWGANASALYILSASFVVAMGIVLVASARLASPLQLGPAHASALGRTTLAGVCVWAYIGFTAFLIVWIADLPHEVTFFVTRTSGAARVLLASLVVVQFVLPFLLLLFHAAKRHFAFLAVLGVLLVVGNLLDCVWLVMPPANMLAAAPLLVFASFAWIVARARFRRHPRVASNDALARALAYEAWS